MSKAKARIEQMNNKPTNIILFYSHQNKEYSSFSQWYQKTPFVVKISNHNNLKIKTRTMRFHNCEQYMMYHKAMLFNDIAIASQILLSPDPKRCKSLGRKVGKQNDNWDQEIWDENKFRIVVEGNYLKFSQNAKYKAILLATGDKLLAEASPYDNIWGIGIGHTHPNAYKPDLWNNTGQNLLGKALMEVRFRLRKELQPESKDIKRVTYSGQSVLDEEKSTEDQIQTTVQETRRNIALTKLKQDYSVNPEDL